MKLYQIAYVDVTCLNSIKEAIEHSCEIEKHYSLHPGMNEYVFFSVDLAKTNSLDEEAPFSEFTRRGQIDLLTYNSKIKEYKDFYKCFCDRLLAVDLSIDDFNLLHDLINRTDQSSTEGFPSIRLRELVTSISDTLIHACYESYSGIKFFSLKNEIIAFVEYPVIKPVVEYFNPKTGVVTQSWGYFLKKPSYCLRFKASETSEKK